MLPLVGARLPYLVTGQSWQLWSFRCCQRTPLFLVPFLPIVIFDVLVSRAFCAWLIAVPPTRHVVRGPAHHAGRTWTAHARYILLVTCHTFVQRITVLKLIAVRVSFAPSCSAISPMLLPSRAPLFRVPAAYLLICKEAGAIGPAISVQTKQEGTSETSARFAVFLDGICSSLFLGNNTPYKRVFPVVAQLYFVNQDTSDRQRHGDVWTGRPSGLYPLSVSSCLEERSFGRSYRRLNW